MNSDQFLRFIAPVDGWYLLVVGNTKELANVPYTLTVYTNGRGLADTTPLSGSVTLNNAYDDYSFANAANDWGFVAVRTDNPGYGEWLTAELHTPTFDSNVLASEGPTTGAQRAGVLAINRYQVGTPNVSLVDLTVELGKDTTKEEINAVLTEYSKGKMKGVLEVCNEPLVSKDFQNNPASSIVDAELTNVIDKRFAKVFSWYDNEWGYSSRVIDLCAFIGKTLPVLAHR